MRIPGKDLIATTLIESTTNNTTNKTVGKYYLTYIQNLQKESRIRYAGMCEVSYSSFIKFNKHLDIPFSNIDVA
ncbi:phage integrase SAM-like domain-containing protein [Bacteroides faecichinchillae]|uniref:phage integrase SAM-like domain-containing protein n=1 Tax=Bacteroides faecichinchillae TaxID=871325 RepID=UPI00351761CE